MIVKIYKNCKLNSKYKDVFFNKTYLETYLGTLDNRTVINDTDIFSRNIDKLYFDGSNIPDFKQYNYLKIEDSIGTFYAFINNIEWQNEVYTIYYEEDIMSNYFEYAHIRNSLLTGNKSLKLYKGQEQRNIIYFKQPIDSESNNYLLLDKTNIPQTGNPKIGIIVKLQLYKLDSADKPTNRISVTGVISNNLDDVSIEVYDMYKYIDMFIEALINLKASRQITYLGSSFYYDIDKIYALPLDFIANNDIPLSLGRRYNLLEVAGSSSGNYYFYFTEYNVQNIDGIIKNYEKVIQYDRTIDSVGIITKPIKIVNNGTNINIKINTYVKGYGFSILLNLQNKIIDITNDFLVDMPFTQVTSSELQLQRLQLNLQENSLNNKIDNTNEEIKRNKGLQETGIIGGLLEELQGRLSGLTSMFSSIINTETNIAQSKNDIKYAEERLKLINQKVYCTTSILANNFSYINAVYGIVIFRIDEDNTLQINQSVKLFGFTVRELVNDVIQKLDIENLTDHYDVFKFDEVNIYGIIAQNYINTIERVLLNGVRVWCQGDIGELV